MKLIETVDVLSEQFPDWKRGVLISDILKKNGDNVNSEGAKLRKLIMPLRDSFQALRDLNMNEQFKFYRVTNSPEYRFVTQIEVGHNTYESEGKTIKEATYIACDLAIKDIIMNETADTGNVNIFDLVQRANQPSAKKFPWHVIASYSVHRYCIKNNIDIPLE